MTSGTLPRARDWRSKVKVLAYSASVMNEASPESRFWGIAPKLQYLLQLCVKVSHNITCSLKVALL